VDICVESNGGADVAKSPPGGQHHRPAEVRRWLGPGEGEALFAARGCPACLHTGYGARTGVFEVLPLSHALRRLIADGQPTPSLHEQAVREGLIELRQAALLQVARGQTTAEEVVRAVASEYLGLEP
jgi:type II secretory ATPase GspE/PulE/Tfp pilus assembly ATPase PilB-like protein